MRKIKKPFWSIAFDFITVIYNSCSKKYLILNMIINPVLINGVYCNFLPGCCLNL